MALIYIKNWAAESRLKMTVAYITVMAGRKLNRFGQEIFRLNKENFR